MLPDMSATLASWSRPYTVKTVTDITIDFEPENLVAVRTIQAVVQVAQKNKLNVESIDWSLRYLWVHTTDPLQNGEFIELDGQDYKIIDNGDFQMYGYTEAVAEQTKRALLLETFVLTYTAGAGGTISGDASQVVQSGSDGTAVTATPATGYTFTAWSDGVLTAARTDTAIVADLTVSALFEAVP